MRISTKYQYLTAIFVIFTIALILSCTDNPTDDDEGDSTTPVDTIDSIKIAYLIPVNDTSIKRDPDTLSKINWDSVPGAESYRVFVYDTIDSTVPTLVIMSGDNTCDIKRYEVNHTYRIGVFAVRDTFLVDYTSIDASVFYFDTTRINTEFGQIVFADSSVPGDTLNKYYSDFICVDSAFQIELGYTILVKSIAPFSILLDSTISDNVFWFVPEGYSLTFKIGFHLYESPDSVRVSGDQYSVTITWNAVAGEYVTGYRIYLRDFNGIVWYSLDSDTVDTITFTLLEENTAYKINVATLSALGPGLLDSNFAVDPPSPDSLKFKLPYIYHSTYSKPDSSIDTNLVGIRGGIFAMGETWGDGRQPFCPGAIPVHEVIVPSFYLNKYEVTCEEYVKFLNDMDTSLFTIDSITSIIKFKNDSIADMSSDTFFISFDDSNFIVDTGKENYPVLSLYWHGAAAYCNWFSQENGLSCCYDTLDWDFNPSANGYRLPTEAEFEYAASGVFTGVKRRFPWGYEWSVDSAAVGEKPLEPVGSYSAYNGFHDLVGSAMEYVNDWSDYLTGANLESSSYYIECRQQGVVINPTGPNSGNKHMMRGGSYASSEKECVVYCRFIHPPDSKISEYGFRVARNAL